MRLIDADDIRYDQLLNIGNKEHPLEWAVSQSSINSIPTIDAEPVRHGQWVNDKGIYKCTACNTLCVVAGWASCIPKKQMYEVFKFCPECGAKMDEVVRC